MAVSATSAAQSLRSGGLLLQTGPFTFRIRSPHAGVARNFNLLYANHASLAQSAPVDFDVQISDGAAWRRYWRRQACFVFDGRAVFEPLPAAHAFALLEWAMNWCISTHAHQYLIVHAAVLSRDDRALILPAPPGSGKSTLCAALTHSGWRLLSDELTLIDMRDGRIWPLCRPVSLKNASIQVVRQFAPQAVFGEVTRDTAKGDVMHMAVPVEHLRQVQQPALARWIVYPRYQAGADTCLQPRPRAGAVVDLARNAFNFHFQGDAGFEMLCDVVEGCDCFDFRYSRLPEAIAAFDALANDTPGA
ncbi:MAG TPA: HprK-related kinase A [Burkholderiaceae bacterium]|nr:HprK-related kinase A [Burkholderiaceae bacterium]